MTRPRDDRWVAVGRVGRPHGRDGAFVVEQPSDDPRRFEVGAVLYVGGDRHEVAESKRAGGKQVIRVDPAVQRGSVLEVPIEALPEPDADSYYVFQLVGLEVRSTDGRRVGVISDVSPGIANDVLELDTGELLPLVKACVAEVDLARRVVVVEREFLSDG